MKQQYDKLVRDRIPEIICASGKVCTTEVLSDREYLQKLQEKLDEEVAEYRESGNHEELADILEVVYALAVATGCSEEALNAIRQDKVQTRGSFSQKILLHAVEK